MRKMQIFKRRLCSNYNYNNKTINYKNDLVYIYLLSCVCMCMCIFSYASEY